VVPPTRKADRSWADTTVRFATVAKRSVKRARQRERHRGSEPRAQPVTRRAHHDRSFWLGALLAAALLIPLAVVAVALIGSGDDEPAAGTAATQNSIQAEAAKLERESQARDKEQVQELTDRMATMLGELGPAVRGLAKSVPPGQERIGPLADRGAVDKWRQTTREAAKYFEDPPSGETTTNVARMGFAAAVEGLIGAIDTYRLALADPAHRRALLESVRAQRDLAVQTWVVGATELDAANHKHGFGHHHLSLAPEGSGGPGSRGR
jgi:hypothetical protein